MRRNIIWFVLPAIIVGGQYTANCRRDPLPEKDFAWSERISEHQIDTLRSCKTQVRLAYLCTQIIARILRESNLWSVNDLHACVVLQGHLFGMLF
jgi:hypothetical protein